MRPTDLGAYLSCRKTLRQAIDEFLALFVVALEYQIDVAIIF